MAKKIERRVVSVKTSVATATPEKPIKKRVVAYCRVSTIAEEQELSFESQKAYYEALLGKDPDKELLKVYGDEGISGLRAAKRPEFQAMIEECRKGNVDEVYAKSVSRFARNYSECLEYARELKSLGICIHFEKENFTTFDDNVDMYFGVMAILAQEESNSISQAINWAIKERRNNGDPIMSARYGYRRDKHKTDGVHKWHVVEEEAIRVRLIYKLYLSGDSMLGVAQKLNEFEKENEGTYRWTVTKVRTVLTNVSYIGDLYCGLTYTADYLSKKVKKNNGERESYYITEHHDPIISKEDFNKAAELRNARNRRTDRKCN